MFRGCGRQPACAVILSSAAKGKAPLHHFQLMRSERFGRQRGAGIGGGNDERGSTLNQLLTRWMALEENFRGDSAWPADQPSNVCSMSP